jgi:hypothetical protein
MINWPNYVGKTGKTFLKMASIFNAIWTISGKLNLGLFSFS